ncbi:MAG: 16S rRNA (guanine(527)-N(7))-methyltransferase RsmG [Nitrospirota bacterium]
MTLRTLLTSGAEKLDIMLSDRQTDAFLVYLVELEKWNRKINLTAIRNEQDIVIKHFLDSLSYLNGFVPAPGLRLLDMGSGAGFPAVPIKICHPEIGITMVEAVNKKASFLRHITRTLKLTEIVIVDKRTNELPASHHGTYDVVTARAFAEMKAAISEGATFLKPGGLMVLSRGPEETVGEGDVLKAGLVIEKKLDLRLPHSNDPRAIWVFRKKR